MSAYGRDFEERVNKQKSQFIVVNGREGDKDSKWQLREVKRGYPAEYKYLECWTTKNG